MVFNSYLLQIVFNVILINIGTEIFRPMCHAFLQLQTCNSIPCDHMNQIPSTLSIYHNFLSYLLILYSVEITELNLSFLSFTHIKSKINHNWLFWRNKKTTIVLWKEPFASARLKLKFKICNSWNTCSLDHIFDVLC